MTEGESRAVAAKVLGVHDKPAARWVRAVCTFGGLDADRPDEHHRSSSGNFAFNAARPGGVTPVAYK